MRYDAAIIGAGADGLTAAATLARAGLKVIVLERALRAGGRLVTDEFHPGHFASPYADAVPEIPLAIARVFHLAPKRLRDLPGALRAVRDEALARAFAEAAEKPPQDFFAQLRAPAAAPWPGEQLNSLELSKWPEPTSLAGAMGAVDPDLAGSAFWSWAVPLVEAPSGGLGTLGEGFLRAARRAGAELRLGQEAVEVVIAEGRAGGVALADGSRVMAGAVISTLDLKQSLLTLFPWSALPKEMLNLARGWRMGGAMARLLLAFGRPLRREVPLFLGDDGMARASFRHGVVPEAPPLLFDPVSRRDPRLAPGAATATVTLGAIPYRLFDGGWSQEKRAQIAARALARIEKALPGTLPSLKAVKIITPPDIEQALNATAGDLDGGWLSPDQMLSLRPGPRTALAGFLSRRPLGAGRPPGNRRGRLRRRGGPDGGWRAMSERAAAIVIGASVSGLAAAAYLARAGRHTLLLEEADAPREPRDSVRARSRHGEGSAPVRARPCLHRP